MKITLVQQDIIWADPEANRKHLDALLGNIGKTDLVLFPEMFSTGFATVPEGIAEKAPAPTIEWMKEKAAQMDCALAGSIAIEEDGRFYNRFCFVKPSGEVSFYDKKHLFTYSGEHKRFSAGDRRVVVEWRGVRFLLAICYDLRFPVWLRNRKDYDALLCVASWPTSRRHAWDSLLRARAIENQCFVAAVDRTGNDPSCSYNGGSVLLDPWGRDIARCRDGVEEAVSAELDMESLAAFRKSFPVLDDAD